VMNTRNIRLLTIQSMMIRVVEALVKLKMDYIVRDNSLRKSYMGNGYIGFVLGLRTELNVH